LGKLLENGKVTAEKIVKVLLDKDQATVGEIGKILDAEDKLSNITYHLKCLVEKNILTVQEKKKGSIYKVKGEYTNIPTSSIYSFTIITVCFIMGVLLVEDVYATASKALLAIGSITGLMVSFFNLKNKRAEKVKTLLDKIR